MKIVILLLFSPMLLIFGALLKNGALSSEPPGMINRLKQALTNNVAETRDDHQYAELRTPVIAAAADETWQRALQAGQTLGWELESSDQAAGSQHWVITTAVFRFKDDFRVAIGSKADDLSTLYILSTSRKGTGDLGANLAHVRSFLEAVGQQP